jgi:hypothetical protein
MAAVEGIPGTVVIEVRDHVAAGPMAFVARPIVELPFVRVVLRMTGHTPIVVQPEQGWDIVAAGRVTDLAGGGQVRPLEDEGAPVVVSRDVVRGRVPVDLVVAPIAQRSSHALSEHGVVDVDVAGQAVVCPRRRIVPCAEAGREEELDGRVRD